MVILTPVPLDDVIAFSANKKVKLKLPRNGFISEIQMRLECKATNGATGPTLHEDNPLGLIGNYRLVRNGNDNFWEMSFTDGYYRQSLVEGTAPERSQHSTTGGATSTAVAEHSIHFKADENNDEDISALLPAHEYTDLWLEIDWQDNNALATANPPTIDANNTFVKVTVIQASLTKEDLALLASTIGVDGAGNPKILSILVRQQEFDVTAVSNNFLFKKNLNIGGLVKDHFIKVINNGLRADDLVDRFRFKQYAPVEKPVDIDDQFWRSAQAKNKRVYSLESIIRGVYLQDWSKRNYLDMTALEEGNIKFETNHAQPTGVAKIVITETSFI